MRIFRYLSVMLIATILISCNKFNGSQEIPAYLRIGSWNLTTNYEKEGAATEAVTDAWVYINGSLQGCYELKNHDDGVYVTVPVLDKGVKTVHLYPGVKMNGIASTRIQYPFYKPYKFTHEFVEGEIGTVSPSTKYYDVDSTRVRFKMMEDFEDIHNVKLDSTPSSKVRIVPVSHNDDPNAWVDPLHPLDYYRSGYIHLEDSINKFDIASKELVGLPTMGNYVMLELDYKCSSEFLVGMYIMSAQNGIKDKELYYFRATDTWKKVYINFSPTVTENSSASYVKFYLRGSISSGETADFYFDNLKLIYIE